MQSQHSQESRRVDLLPSDWVDYIFSKLQLAYGRDFLAQWPGLDITAVKSDWAEKLAGLENRTHAIDHALEHLPSEKPVNALRFRDLCRMAPDASNPALLPRPAVNNRLAAKVLVEASKIARSGGDTNAPIRALMLREINGGAGLTFDQKRNWRQMLRTEIRNLYGIDTAQPFDLHDLAVLVKARDEAIAKQELLAGSGHGAAAA